MAKSHPSFDDFDCDLWASTVLPLIVAVRTHLRIRYRGVLSEEDISDVLQEAQIASCRAFATYDKSIGTVKAWFQSIVSNKVVDLLRKRGERQCRDCRGTGELAGMSCPRCRGRGWLQRDQSFKNDELDHLIDGHSPESAECNETATTWPHPDQPYEQSREWWASLSPRQRVAWQTLRDRLSATQRLLVWLVVCGALPPYAELTELWGIANGTLRKAYHDAKEKLLHLPPDVWKTIAGETWVRLFDRVPDNTHVREPEIDDQPPDTDTTIWVVQTALSATDINDGSP